MSGSLIAYRCRNALIGLALGLWIVASIVLIAAADHGGWSPWRVAMACFLPITGLCAGMGATYPGGPHGR